MIGRLILRHEILHTLTKPLLITVTTVSLMLNILAFQAARSHMEGQVDGAQEILAQYAFLIPFIVILWMGKANERCRPWETGLPLASRPLWLAYLGALVLGITLLIGVSGVAFMGFGSLVGAFSDDVNVRMADLLRLVARPASVSLLGACLVAAWRPGTSRMSGEPGWSRHKALVLVGALALLGVLLAIPMVFSLFPVLVAGLLIWRVPQTLPPSLDMGGTGNGEGLRTGESADWVQIGPSGRVVRYMFLRTLFKWPISWIAMGPIAIVFGMMMSNTEILGLDNPNMRVTNFFLVIYILFAMSNHFMESLYKVDHLPIDRRVLLRWLILPIAVMFMVGYGAGQVIEMKTDHRAEEIIFDNTEDGYGLKVPPAVWEFSMSSEPRSITAPWGESHPAQAVPVLAGLPGVLWKPFTTPAGASIEFIAWQISRAAEDVYGLEIDPDEIAARYLEMGAGGRTEMRTDALTIMADYPAARTMESGPIFPFWIGAELLGLLLVNLVFFRAFKPGVTLRKSRVVFWVLMGGLMALHIGGYVLFIKGVTKEWVISGFWMGLIRDIGAAGFMGVGAVWVAAILLLALAWRFAEQAFLKAEAPSS